mmetsp:Transcript_67679/g.133588  ORF Transcript_67679/g.133588 Transcript_67679/m.133588 type:complete len:105 (+) Transcript_67679:211-525(+)
MRSNCTFLPQGKWTLPATGFIGSLSASTFFLTSYLQLLLTVIAYRLRFQKASAAVLQEVTGQLISMKSASSPKPTSISAWWSTTWVRQFLEAGRRMCLSKLDAR